MVVSYKGFASGGTGGIPGFLEYWQGLPPSQDCSAPDLCASSMAFRRRRATEGPFRNVGGATDSNLEWARRMLTDDAGLAGLNDDGARCDSSDGASEKCHAWQLPTHRVPFNVLPTLVDLDNDNFSELVVAGSKSHGDWPPQLWCGIRYFANNNGVFQPVALDAASSPFREIVKDSKTPYRMPVGYSAAGQHTTGNQFIECFNGCNCNPLGSGGSDYYIVSFGDVDSE